MSELNNIDDITTFKSAFDNMIVKSTSSWNDSLGITISRRRVREYTRDEVESIINGNSLEA
jgi:hypothetical protein